jgi:thymidylate synthase (FAD)
MVRAPARVFAVAETAPLHVQLIAKTEFVAPSDVPWSTDAGGGTTPLRPPAGTAWRTA